MANSGRPTCVSGHPWAAETTAWEKWGTGRRRVCTICQMANGGSSRKAKSPQSRAKTCRRGHPATEKNSRWRWGRQRERGKGRYRVRECVPCAKERKAARKAETTSPPPIRTVEIPVEFDLEVEQLLEELKVRMPKSVTRTVAPDRLGEDRPHWRPMTRVMQG